MTGPAPSRPARATLMLVAVTFFWGMSFSWTHTWQLAAGATHPLLSGLTLIGLRMPLALAVLAAWQPGAVFGASRREFVGGLTLGALFFAGFALQTWGLAHTSPALSSFFTSVCSAWVPLLAWLAFRVAPRPLTVAGLGVGLLGCAVMVNGWELNRGDALTLGASVLFAVELIALDRIGKTLDPTRLSGGFFAVMGLLGALGAAACAASPIGPGLRDWAGWAAGMLARPEPLRAALGLAVLPTAVAFHWMNSYQPRVSASHAAVIYLLEPVFSSLFSVFSGHDHWSTPLLLGGGLVLAGNLLVEMHGRRPGKPG